MSAGTHVSRGRRWALAVPLFLLAAMVTSVAPSSATTAPAFLFATPSGTGAQSCANAANACTLSKALIAAGPRQREQKCWCPRVVKQRFIAALHRPTNPLALGRSTPIGGRRHGAAVGGKTDQGAIAAVLLTDQLSDIPFAPSSHLGGARVAQVRIVRPQYHLGLLPLPREMLHQRIQGLGHVHVAEVPGRDSSPKHRAVILFRVLYQARVLLGVEEIVSRDAPISPGVLPGAPLKVDQLSDDFGFAGMAEPEPGGIAVLLRIFPELLKAGIAMAGPLGSFRIDFIQIVQNRFDGRVQTVQV